MGAPKKVRKLEQQEVSIPELAQLFRVSDSAVMKMAREGGMPKAARGRYPLMACVHWRLDQIMSAQEEDSSDVTEARKKLYDTQRAKHELEMAELRKELLVAEEVATVLRGLMAIVATQLDGLGPRVAYQVAGLTDPAKISKVILSECRHIRRAAAEQVQAFAGDLDGGEDAGAAARPKRRRVGRRAPDPAPGQSGAGAVAN